MSALDTAVALRDKYLSEHGLEIADFGLNFQYPPIPSSNWEWYKIHRMNQKQVYNRVGFFLLYLNPQGDVWLDNEIPYGVVRFLSPPLKVPEGQTALKVISQWGRRSEIHFEPIRDGRSWEALEQGTVVLHCESLIKAKAVHKATGIPCVGYNGVWGFSSAKMGIELIHQYTGFAFHQMHNVILFDSDVLTNPNVNNARETLSHKLRHIANCDKVSWADLPQRLDEKTGELSKWGPDDFLLEKGVEALAAIIAEAKPYQDEEYAELVEEMNKRLRWVKDQSAVYDRSRRCLIKWSDAQNTYANVNREVPWGKVKRTVYGTDVWLKSEHREDIDSVGYRYLSEEFFERDKQQVANLYTEGGSKAGPYTLPTGHIVMDMLTRLFKHDDLELMRSYLKFLKFTGDKPTSYCVLWSTVRGVGKGWFTELAKALIGMRHVGTATADSLAAQFNAHTVNLRLLIVHEFKASSRNEKTMALNYLKTYIADRYIMVRAMHQNAYTGEVNAGLIVTVNDKSDMPSDGLGDRRQWYIEAGAGAREREVELWSVDDGKWKEAFDALKDEECMEAVARWVEDGEGVDFKSWKPPMTEERAEDLMSGMSQYEQIANEVLLDARSRGVRVMDGKAIRQLMLAKLEGQEIYLVGKAFGGMLRTAGWWMDKAFGLVGPTRSTPWFTSEVPPKSVTSSHILNWIREDSAKWGEKY